jgi:hypothetical protein
METSKLTEAEIQQFIAQSKWTFAKTMAKTPHEYTLRRNSPNEPMFERFVMHIRQHGYRGIFGKTKYSYFDVDGWQYWTMGYPVEQTTLINRARKPT